MSWRDPSEFKCPPGQYLDMTAGVLNCTPIDNTKRLQPWTLSSVIKWVADMLAGIFAILGLGKPAPTGFYSDRVNKPKPPRNSTQETEPWWQRWLFNPPKNTTDLENRLRHPGKFTTSRHA